MKTLIISYSLTGNNATLAKGLAENLNVDYAELKEQGKRNVFTIVLDVIFNRVPKIQPVSGNIESYDNLLFIAPIWLGKVASPFRRLFQSLNNKVKNYSFVSISAGADGKNPNLEKELTSRLGKKPAFVFNPLITELLPASPKPSRKILDEYRLQGTEAKNLIDNVASELKQALTI